VVYNHEWLNKLNFAEVIQLASNFTVQQYLVRDRLRKRIEANEPLWLSELLYPLAQGCDAVHLRADVQIGGSEQLFNLMAGRKLQEVKGQKPQVCLAFPLLPGLDGKNKMSKSLGIYIGVNESPESQFGKIMSLPDELILTYFRLVTRWNPEQIAYIESGLKEGRIHPMMAKKQLATEVVSSLNGDEAALQAGEAFNKVHQQREMPQNMPEFKMVRPMTIVDILVETGLCASKSEAKRVIQQNGVKIDGVNVNLSDKIIESGEAILQKGRNGFVRLI
jgi:tyrosyl-tRNA synthetase